LQIRLQEYVTLSCTMGNRCMRPETEEKFEILKREKPEQRQPPVVVVDWDDEKSVHHRSAMNSLHNYALGKMANLDPSETPAPASPCNCGIRKVSSTSNISTIRRCSSQNIKFANELHQTFHFDRQSVDFERPSLDTPPADILDNATHAGSCPPPPPRSSFLPAEPSPTSSVFMLPAAHCAAVARCGGAGFGSPPHAAPLHLPRCHSEPAMPVFPGPADITGDPVDFPRLE
jgi:hypothetical protein